MKLMNGSAAGINDRVYRIVVNAFVRIVQSKLK